MLASTLYRIVLASLLVIPLSVAWDAQPVRGAQGDCSQPVSSGSGPVASDCLFILGVAVGLQTCTPEACVCDPTGEGATTASDALTCLKRAVGEPLALLCPCVSNSTSTTSSTTTTLSGGTADCTNDGSCGNDDCVCADCDDDPFCSSPSSCTDNGVCNTFVEGCVCADCMNIPECADN